MLMYFGIVYTTSCLQSSAREAKNTSGEAGMPGATTALLLFALTFLSSYIKQYFNKEAW